MAKLNFSGVVEMFSMAASWLRGLLGTRRYACTLDRFAPITFEVPAKDINALAGVTVTFFQIPGKTLMFSQKLYIASNLPPESLLMVRISVVDPTDHVEMYNEFQRVLNENHAKTA